MTIDFFNTAANLKKIHRQGWVDKLSMNNPESVADHSYSMAMMGMVISDLEDCDSEKILKMVLLHDLAESEIGDYTPGQITPEKKTQLENKAFSKILENLPDSLKSQYQEIWNEYIDNTTLESTIVHQIDKLEMVLQAKLYENEGYSKEKLRPFIESSEKEITNPRLKELFRMIVEEG